MGRRRLIWYLYPSIFLVVLVSLGAVDFFAAVALRRFHLEQTAAGLEQQGRLVAALVAPLLAANGGGAVDDLCKELGRESATRYTVILPSGKVIGETERDPLGMESHADRPEVRQALAGGTGRSVRFSNTVRQDLVYVALPLREAGRTVAVVRLSFPLTAVSQALRPLRQALALGGLAIVLLAGVVGFAVSRRISRPLEEMQRGAERFAAGDFTRLLPVPRSLELGGLAETLNRMAGQLEERIGTVVRQRNELEAVLASMKEGVIAVDPEMRLLRLNRAAADLLELDGARSEGRSLQEVVRNPALEQFCDRALSSAGPVEGEVALYHGGERHLEAHGTPLQDARGKRFGALVVLHDVTRLRRLETVRREFVANVSHELKTPVTSIKGFVETLANGAVGDPEKAGRFLGIVRHHADRLGSIIDDLLTLSRLEQFSGEPAVRLESRRLGGLLETAVAACQVKAEERRVKIALDCPEALEARVSDSLFEQAVINLVDNAIQYSREGGEVEVTARPDGSEVQRTPGSGGGEAQTTPGPSRGGLEGGAGGDLCGVVVRVRDRGCGIEREHLSRIFERFYRVDKGRSRKLGGTGLGLAIVKHIAQVHGGSVEVESVPGEGSTFSIRLPRV